MGPQPQEEERGRLVVNRIVGAPGSSTTNHPTPNQQEKKEERGRLMAHARVRACVLVSAD